MAQYALISTEKGDMKAELYTEETPGTVANFVELANHNFYDGLTFHRVIPGFVIQGGCPRGDGTGGPGYKIKCETSAPRQYHDRGVLSMAHAGKDTGGSQFFICCARESTQHLDSRHTCFGRVVEGLDVIDDIRPGDLILSIRIAEEQICEPPRGCLSRPALFRPLHCKSLPESRYSHQRTESGEDVVGSHRRFRRS